MLEIPAGTNLLLALTVVIGVIIIRVATIVAIAWVIVHVLKLILINDREDSNGGDGYF